MLTEDETIRVYHHTDNSKVYHEKEPSYLEVDQSDASTIEILIKEYPKYVKVSELHEDTERGIKIIQDFYDFGLIMKKKTS